MPQSPPSTEPIAAAPPATRTRSRGLVVAMLRWLVIGSSGVVGIAIVLWLVLQWGILPRIEVWRPAIEQRASEALGVPVSIGVIRAVDSGIGWTGAFEMEQVMLLDPQTKQEALRLPLVRAALSAASLYPGWDGVWRLRLRQLVLDEPELEIRRDDQGRLWVAGLDVGAARGDGDGALADWFFSQREFLIRGGRVQWTDASLDVAPLVLGQVDLVLRNGVRRHALRLDATPPAPWGERWSLRGDFTQPLLAASPLAAPASGSVPARIFSRPGDWQRWQGSLYAEMPAIDLTPMQPYLATFWAPTQGVGALRAWVDVRQGRVLAATADLQLRDVSLRLAPELGPLTLAQIGGRIAIKHEPAEPDRDEGWSVDLKQLGFATAAGPEWPAADGRLAWRRAADGTWTGGELVAPKLYLGRLSQVLSLLPADWVGADLQARAASLGAEGEATDVEASWSGPLLAPQRYRIKAQLRGLKLAPAESSAPDLSGHIAPARPGVQGADIELDVTETGGDAKISVRNGALTFPGVFAQPRIELATLDTKLEWRIQPAPQGVSPKLELEARDLKFTNADLQGQLDLQWTRGGVTPVAPLGVIDLSAKLGRVDAVKVPRYLPLALGGGLEDYLRRALQAGQASGVSVVVRGPLAEFPFAASPAATASAAGEFRLAVQMEGVRFAYLPGDAAWNGDPTDVERRPWPAFNDVKGELVFERQTMQLRKLGGRLGTVGSGGLVLRDVDGSIRELGSANPVLVIDGNVRGPLNDALRYVDATPVGGWLGDALAQASATVGTQPPIDLQLGLTIPLNDGPRTQVRGKLQIAGNDLKLRPDVPLLAAARARVEFTERSFTLNQGAATVLGGDAQFDGASQPDGSMRFNVQGTASAESLRRTPELGALASAAGILSGQTDYKVALGFVRDHVEWQFSSSLAGLGVDLPAPLGKRAEQTLPLRVQVSLQPTPAAGALQRDTLRVDLGPDTARVLQAQYLRELAPGGARVLRGGLAVGATAGEPLPQPAKGVAANLVFSQLDLAAWQRAADKLVPDGSAAPASANAASAAGYLPDRLNLRAQTLTVGGYPLTDVKATVSRDSGLWALDIDAKEVAGHAEYRPPGAVQAKDAGRVMARLARLSIPKGADDPVRTVLDKTTATSLPAIDVVIDDFELRGKRLGRLEIDAVNRAAEGPDPTGSGEWQLKLLRLVTPQDEALFNGTGRWAAPVRAGEPRRVMLDFTLEVADGGALLARLGQADVIKGAKGSIGGQIGWLGSPLALDYPSLDGQMTLSFERGQFLQADPGVAKLLGVLSLQSLPRRMLLDFSDVFEKGFAFDAITGDVTLVRGVASTRNLKMRGVQATVLMEGGADVQLETQDLRVWVIPDINANAASLAYIAINPVVGIGAFLAQLFLQRPLAAATTREFHVTGPWAAPLVVPVVRTSPDAGPPPAASAPGAGAP